MRKRNTEMISNTYIKQVNVVVVDLVLFNFSTNSVVSVLLSIAGWKRSPLSAAALKCITEFSIDHIVTKEKALKLTNQKVAKVRKFYNVQSISVQIYQK